MLELKGVSSGYGNIPVVRNVSFRVDPGEIVLIAGENGAGKSTLLRTIAGFIKPESGAVMLGDRNISGKNPEDIVDAGLRLVLDGHRVFPELTVMDNLRLGALAGKGNRAPSAEAIEEVLDTFSILKQKASNLARDLSGGQQQMLALGQAFMARPKVLLCDEPSLGLARALLPQILDFLKAWAAQGAAIVIVEQHVEFALTVASRALLFERGSVKHSGPAKDFMTVLVTA